MTSTRLLHDLLAESAANVPGSPAVVEPGVGALTWQQLDALSDRVRDRLHALGVRMGDRVGLYLPKTIDGIATVYGILKAGGVYVPVDPDAPPARCALIFSDCEVRVVVTEARLAERLQAELTALEAAPALLQIPKAGGGAGITAALDAADATAAAPNIATQRPRPTDLAYILYTSGSTGRPKGVMLTHLAGMSYVEWCSDVFAPTSNDRFSSHAPLHFDLSILDLYASAAHGAAVVLLGEDLGKDPLRLAEVIANEGITVWYSTPSILSLLTQYGKLERHDHSSLRYVLFAGEVFPVPRLREVVARWPHPRYFNLYGPTETNVCTYYEVKTPVPDDRIEPYPIGRTCENLRSRVVDLDGTDVAPGDEGELVINGGNVMEGYWNLPERNALAFIVDDKGDRWYRTGDLVVLDSSGDHVFHGRRDRMVKRRGYRIELGEIEAGLATHPAVREVAVVADQAVGADVRITAVLSVNGEKQPSTIELKQFCMERLPKYMVPDRFTFVLAMPRTSTDKIDYQSLIRPTVAAPAPATA